MSRIITEWNNTKQDYPRNINLIQLIEQQVAHTPSKTACYFNEERYSFASINARANQLAHYISQCLNNSGHNILIHLDRSVESIITLLAILKSGNSYVPIEHGSPIEFVQKVVNDCSIKLIVSDNNFLKDISKPDNKHPPKLINITIENTNISRMPRDNLSQRTYNQLAYTLYTSGSTGQPKGVQISQNSLINLLFAMQKEIKFTAADSILAITPLTFDISAAEFYLPLLFGGSFILADAETRYNPYKIIATIERHAISVMQATPITWQMLINTGWKNSHQIKMLCGGEGLSTALASKLFKTGAPLWNFYGPTETTIWSTCHKVKKIIKKQPFVAIGRPLANTQVFILDENLQPKAIGETGELYISGDGVALGYLNLPELNATSFIDSSLSTTKLYKTGDLAYFDKEHTLHYVGRKDTQIKINGHRVEIEAIENILLEHPDIKESVVIAENEQNSQILVAYLVLNTENINLKELNTYLHANLPAYMVPGRYLQINKIPLTNNGKIARKKLTNNPNARPITHNNQQHQSIENNFEKIILELTRKQIKKHNISPTSNFQELGIHSIGLVNLTQAINQLLNISINVIDLINYPTIRSFAKFLLKNQNTELKQQYQEAQKYLQNMHTTSAKDNSIAIIGMACRFPGADNYQDFWKLILNKTNAISFFSEEELLEAGVPLELINNKDYVPARGILHDVDKFDANFFNINPADAKLMDPQHRIFLEQSWSALEDAGYIPDEFVGRISVFAGMNDSSYLQTNILKNQQVQKDTDQQQIMLATSPHYLATKVSYNLGLSGPSITLNTACSTGLVAINMAVANLNEFKSDMAIAGAINITVPQTSGYLYRELGIFSADGYCNVFADDAQGTVISNGCGVVILKRLSEALRDNDNILAVIKGSAINNDGATKSGFTSPSIQGQIKCIQDAIQSANIDPKTVEFIEAHGTGTIVGDPIEVAALSEGYQFAKHKKSAYCTLGSVKANIGHTDTASGIAGFIKASLAIYYKTLPANINYTKNNHQINFEETPFFISTENKAWQSPETLRTAGVNSLGFGGTNAHVILQETPKQPETTISKSANIFLISAKVTSSFNQAITNIKQHLLHLKENDPNETLLADSAYTAQIGRQHFKERLAITYSGYDQLLEILNSPEELTKRSMSTIENQNRKIVFGFVGQGSQYASMAYDIYIQQPTFRKIVDECLELIEQEIQIDLKKILFPTTKLSQQANVELTKTENAQPCLFIIEYALAKFLISLGISPTGMIGHSLGEYVAAAVAEVLSIQDAIKLIIARSKLMASTRPGVMLAIPMSQEEIQPHLCDSATIAAQNAPNLCVVSGSIESTEKFLKNIKPILKSKDLNYQRLHTSHAFHSQYMEPILDEFLEAIKDIRFNKPTIPYISNISGDWITEEDIQNKKYWAKHMRNAVLFSDGIENLDLDTDDIFIEIGPGSTLSQLILQHKSPKPQILNTIPNYVNSDENSYQFILNTIAKLWLLKLKINWQELYTNEIRRRIKLPTYPFAKQTFWIQPTTKQMSERDNSGAFIPTWERQTIIKPRHTQTIDHEFTWLIFGNDEKINQQLQKQFTNTYQISLTDSFTNQSPQRFTINPRIKKHFVKLLQQIKLPNNTLKIIHSNLLTTGLDTDTILHHGPFSLLYLTQAFAEVYPDKNLHILILSQNLYNVLGNENIEPIKASILGPCKVIPQEYVNIKMKLLDIEARHIPSLDLINEANNFSKTCYKDEIALRAKYRWVQKLQSYNLIQPLVHKRLKKNATYIITGGLGGLGLTIAEYLATNYNANLILISRGKTLDEDQWQDFLEDPKNTQHGLYAKISRLFNIKTYAQSLSIHNISITNQQEVANAIRKIKKDHKLINGVIHAAGVAGKGVSELKTLDEYKKVLAPKLLGTEYLLNELTHEKLDFFALFSSTTAVTGFPGQIDYCSANRVLDAYINKAAATFTHDVFCTTINWQAWREVGMAADSESMLIDLDETNSIAPEYGCKLFSNIINSEEPQVIVSSADLNYYDSQNLSLAPQIKPIKVENNEHEQQRSHTIQNLLDIWHNILGISKIAIDDDFYELGGNSLLAISLIAKIRARFNINIPSTTLFKERTINSLAKIIESHKNEVMDITPLVQLKKGSTTKPPIFLVHPIGGTVFCYLQLANYLHADRTIYALQDPSIECNSNIFKTIKEQASYYRNIIEKTQPKGPYYLCGASYGASVVMEIAHQLEKSHKIVNFVGLIDGWAITEKQEYDQQYIHEVIKLHADKKQTLSNIDKQQIFEKLVSERLKMMQQHTFKKITAPVSLFKAQEILKEYQSIDCKDNHWSKYLALPLRIISIPGDHNTMLEKPHVQILAHELDNCIQAYTKQSEKAKEISEY